MDNRTKEIINDLAKRKLTMLGIVAKDEKGRFQIFSYDKNGSVSYISEKVKNMEINTRLDGNMVRRIVKVRGKVDE